MVDLFNTRGGDLICIHRVITRALKVSIDKVKELQQAGFTNDMVQEGYVLYLRSLVWAMRAHHSGEDDIVFPLMKELQIPAAYEELEMDHRALESFLYDVEGAVQAVSSGDDSNALPALQDALLRIHALWHPHIAKEELDLLPASLQVMGEPEEQELNQRLMQHAQKTAGPPAVMVPFNLFNLSAEDRAYFSRNFPPEVLEDLVPGAWRAEWMPMKPYLLD